MGYFFYCLFQVLVAVVGAVALRDMGAPWWVSAISAPIAAAAIALADR